MQPDYPNSIKSSEPDTTSTDYLNQIAPKPISKFAFLRRKPFFIGTSIISILLVLLIVLGITSLFSDNKISNQQMLARLQSTRVITDSTKGNLKNPKLQVTNAQLASILNGKISQLSASLESQNIDTKKLSKTIVKAESSQEILDKLEEARLNAVYDNVYVREMNYQLQMILNLSDQLSKSSTDETKEFLASLQKDIQTVKQDLEAFSN